jgi:hypothetical protein
VSAGRFGPLTRGGFSAEHDGGNAMRLREGEQRAVALDRIQGEVMLVDCEVDRRRCAEKDHKCELRPAAQAGSHPQGGHGVERSRRVIALISARSSDRAHRAARHQEY